MISKQDAAFSEPIYGPERLCLWAAGVSPRIITFLPGEKHLYVSVGAGVIFTAVMAAVSGYFCFSLVLQGPDGVAVPVEKIAPLAAFWALLIGNLDRSLVCNTPSWRSGGNGPAKLVALSARVILAILISIVVSIPLELHLFRDSIQTEVRQLAINAAEGRVEKAGLELDSLRERQPESTRAINEAARVDESTLPEYAAIKTAKDSLAEAEKAELAAKEETDKASADAYWANGKVSRGAATTRTEEASRAQRLAVLATQKAREELNTAETTLAAAIKAQKEGHQQDVQNRLNRLHQTMQEAEHEEQKARTALNAAKSGDPIQAGLLMRIKALEGMSAPFYEDPNFKPRLARQTNPSSGTDGAQTATKATNSALSTKPDDLVIPTNPIWWTKWLVRVLVILIEVIPILLKVTSRVKHYDELANEVSETNKTLCMDMVHQQKEATSAAFQAANRMRVEVIDTPAIVAAAKEMIGRHIEEWKDPKKSAGRARDFWHNFRVITDQLFPGRIADYIKGTEAQRDGDPPKTLWSAMAPTPTLVIALLLLAPGIVSAQSGKMAHVRPELWLAGAGVVLGCFVDYLRSARRNVERYRSLVSAPNQTARGEPVAGARHLIFAAAVCGLLFAGSFWASQTVYHVQQGAAVVANNSPPQSTSAADESGRTSVPYGNELLTLVVASVVAMLSQVSRQEDP